MQNHRPLLRRTWLVATAALAVSAFAATGAYDETADAKAQIQAALLDAQQAHVPLLVVFGANWCGDCKVLDLAFKEGPAAPLIAEKFRVVKVNVGRFDRNVDVAEAYGVPLKSGIPAVAVLSAQGQVEYATKAGELSNARKMGDASIYNFFADLASPHAR